MTISIINPNNNCQLNIKNQELIDIEGNTFPIIRGVPRIAKMDNYTNNFGIQWNVFRETQIDRKMDGLSLSEKRFFAETGWNATDLNEKNLLEVGSGAGRFSKVVLERTNAILYSIDYSDAVSANFINNGKIAPNRFHLFQASIYELPFSDNSFDKIFCLGVLQHTPDFRASVEALIRKTKVGGEIVIDFYPIKGWWTFIHAKYILRYWTRKIKHAKLLKIIDNNIDWLIFISKILRKSGLGILARFLPLVDLNTMPTSNLTDQQLREWIVLDTFDMFAPEHDHPQRITDVANMFVSLGATVTFAGFVEYDHGFKVAVVRGIKQ